MRRLIHVVAPRSDALAALRRRDLSVSRTREMRLTLFNAPHKDDDDGKICTTCKDLLKSSNA